MTWSSRPALAGYTPRVTDILFIRIDARLKELGISASEASARTGMGRGLIADLKRRPKKRVMSDTLDKLALALETTVDYLLGHTDDPSMNAADMVGPRPLPLLEPDSHGGLAEAPRRKRAASIYPGEEPVSHSAFAFVVPDDSMVPALKEGDTLIADPERRPKPGSTVIARVGRDVLVREYRARREPESGRDFALLVPLNDAYPPLEISWRSPGEILGTVAEIRRSLAAA